MKIFSLKTVRDKFLSSPKLKVFAKSLSYSLVARVVGLLNLILVTPLILNYFGDIKFGIWTLIISVVKTMGFADLGLGNGLLNYLIINKDNTDSYKNRLVSSTYAVVLIVAATFLISVLCLYFSDFKNYFITDELGAEDFVPFAIAISLFLFNIPLALIQKIQYSNLDNDVFHAYELAQKVLTIGSLLILVFVEASFNLIITAFFLVPIIINLINSWIYYSKHEIFRPNFANVDLPLVKPIFNIGVLYLVLGILHIIVNSGDNFLITYFLGVKELTYFQVGLKPFELLGTIIIACSGILWPFFGEAMVRKDTVWLRGMVNKGIIGVLGFSLLSFPFVIYFFNPIIDIWFSYERSYSFTFALYLGLYMSSLYLGVFLAAFLNGANMVKELVWVFLLYLILVTPFKIWALYGMGLNEFIIFNFIFSFAAKGLFPFLMIRNKLNSLNAEREKQESKNLSLN